MGGGFRGGLNSRLGSQMMIDTSQFGQKTNPLTEKAKQEVQKFEFLPQNVNILQIKCTQQQTFLLSTNSVVYNWGRNNFGAKRPVGQELIPKKIDDGDFSELDFNEKIIDIQTGYNHILALSNFGIIYAWGVNSLGQLGIGNQEKQASPVKIQNLKQYNIIKIYAAADCSFAIGIKENQILKTKENFIFSWGDNRQGQLGVDGMFHKEPQIIKEFPVNTQNIEIYHNPRDNSTTFYTYEEIIKYDQSKLDQRYKNIIEDKNNMNLSNDEKKNQKQNLGIDKYKKFTPFEVQSNDTLLDIRKCEYKINVINEEIRQQQQLLIELQEKNNQEILDNFEFDDPLVDNLEQTLETIEDQLEKYQIQQKQVKQDIKNLTRDENMLKIEQQELQVKEEQITLKKQQLQQEIQKGKTASAEQAKRKLKALKEVISADENSKHGLAKRLNQIKEVIGLKKEEKEHLDYQIQDTSKKQITHKQLITERKLQAKQKQQNSNQANQNKFDIQSLMVKINHFQKILKDSNVNDLSKKGNKLKVLDMLIAESNQLLKKCTNELAQYRQQIQTDPVADVIQKYCNSIDHNLQSRLKNNLYSLQLMVPTQKKLNLMNPINKQQQQQTINQDQILLDAKKKNQKQFEDFFKQQSFQPSVYQFYYQQTVQEENQDNNTNSNSKQQHF